MMLVAVVVFSLYTILVTPLIERHGGPEVMCWATLLAAPLMLVLNAQAALVAPYAELSPGIWSAFFWAVLASAFLGVCRAWGTSAAVWPQRSIFRRLFAL